MKAENIVKLVVALVVCYIAAFIGSLFTTSSIDTWYSTIQKPAFTPPNWVFGPVWTTLFTLMGISLFLIIRKGFADKDVRIGVVLFAAQLVLNILWSVIFFTLHQPFYSFIEIIGLWIAIFFTTFWFWKISRLGSSLLFPYLLWVAIAALLNFYVWILNG